MQWRNLCQESVVGSNSTGEGLIKNRWGRSAAAMNRLGLVFCGLLVCFQVQLTAADRPPNVVLILMDDMGWRDVGFMGNSYVETPHLDRLASRGLVFTQAYASAPNCAPTRLHDVRSVHTEAWNLYCG